MTNWIMAQQVVLSFSLLLLLMVEKTGLKVLGARCLYFMWILLPLILVANNLPKDLLSINNTVLYQYLVKVTQHSNQVGSLLTWQILWFIGAISVVVMALVAQWQITQVEPKEVDQTKLPLSLPNSLKVFESTHTHSPLLTGIWPAKLLLPLDFTSKFTIQQQQLILQHELVHFQRWDNLHNLLALVFVAIFWFNPLIWFAYVAFRRSQEIACDTAVLQQKTTNDKISYSKALLLCTQKNGPALSLYSQYGAKHPMLLRIEHIKNQTVIKKSPIILSAFAAFSLLAGVAMANQQGNVIDSSQINEAEPILRIEPKYPVNAAQQSIEGSVVLQFDIEKDGTTSNIKIIKAEPQETFGKTSIAALQKWQYKPRIMGGQAQVQHNILVQLDYRLDENPSPIKPLIETVKILQ